MNKSKVVKVVTRRGVITKNLQMKIDNLHKLGYVAVIVNLEEDKPEAQGIAYCWIDELCDTDSAFK